VNKLGKDFWVFRLGQFFSDLGNAAFGIAIPWWVLESTGSVKNMSILIVSGLVVKLIAGLFFAPLADRYSRKRLILLSNIGSLLSMLIISSFLYADSLSMPYLIIASSFGALFWALFDVSHNAFVSNIVDKENLPNAFGQIQMIGAITAMFGGIFGASLVSSIGIFNVVLFNGITFIFAFVCTLFVRGDSTINRTQNEGEWRSKELLRDFVFGFVALLRFKVIFRIVVFFSLVSFILAPLQVLMPYIVNVQLGLTPIYLGGLTSACGAGAILGSYDDFWCMT
jgi:MFS transporter, DHA3 family, macrolide efflux protein